MDHAWLGLAWLGMADVLGQFGTFLDVLDVLDVLGRFRTSWDFLDVFGRFWMFYRVSKLDKREIKRLLGHQKCTLKL